MYKLTNISTLNFDLKNFNNDYNEMKSFLDKHKLDGFELIQYVPWDNSMMPKEFIKGFHMKFFPVWLDFWKEDMEEVLSQFKSIDVVENYYGGLSKKAIVDYYKNELKLAKEIGAQYVVFHVGHVQVEHTYNYKFTYSDKEVIEATIELVNEIFEDKDDDISLLFENLWWPGLTMLDNEVINTLMNGVKYKNKGVMLDTSHLLNTNIYLKNEVEAIEYLYETIEKLGRLKNYIKGIHLNFSLSGEYVLDTINNSNKSIKNLDFNALYIKTFDHIGKIDEHKPFLGKGIKEFVEFINPEYLIYEFLSESFKDINDWIYKQNEVLGY